MHRRFLQILSLAVCLGLLPTAFAKGGKGGGPPAGKGKGSSEHGSKGKDKDRDKDEGRSARGHHGESEHAQGPSSRPSGWDKGRKTGWGDCDVPPGLAKKRGCDSSGLSARERAAHKSSATAAGHTAVKASTTKSAKAGPTTTTTKPAAAQPTQTKQTRNTTRTPKEGRAKPIVE